MCVAVMSSYLIQRALIECLLLVERCFRNTTISRILETWMPALYLPEEVLQ